MKGIFLVIDGMADWPCKILNNKTPLEAAYTPNMDFFASRGKMGFMHTVKPGFTPESDEAIVSLFGNKIEDSSRGWLEAKGAGVQLKKGDLALRANFATIDSLENGSGNILDRRAGRTLTNKEAEILSRELNKIDVSCDFEFKPTIQHRGVLVFKGSFSDKISGNDFTYSNGKTQELGKTSFCKALDRKESSYQSVNVVNEFLEKAYEVLRNHPVNKDRQRRGLLPANFILVRGGGVETPNLKQYRNWMSISYMPLEKGFSIVSKMNLFDFSYPKLKKLDVYENLHQGLKKASKFSSKKINKNMDNYDYVYIHLKETDVPGHDNKPLEKKMMIEEIDKILFSFLRSFCPKNKVSLVVSADHTTPCRLKAHSEDPVPVLYYNPEEGVKPEKAFFNEESARKGSLGRLQPKSFLKDVGFRKK